jgi:hypothetical protein
MLEAITNTIVKEINSAVARVVNAVQRRLIRIALKAFFVIAGLTALSIGIILIGAKYVGLDLMLVAAGIVLLVAFFLS